MKASLAAVLLVAAGCAGAQTPTPAPVVDACCFVRGLEIARDFRVASIPERRFTQDQYWGAIAGPLASPRFKVEEIGRSIQGRPLRALTIGTGPVKVLAWSQMHGDESTASMSLLDLITWLASDTPDPVRDRLLAGITLTLVPMLNPDGAELFQRQNAIGVDINRDARRLATPEARALKGLRDRIVPDFGFNLHDQNARTLVGPEGKQAGIALLAPPVSEDRSYNDVRARARLVAARLAHQFAREIPGQVAKYDDSFNPRAFGDLMQAWGTSTVLIESGALAGDPQKQRLRALNLAALLDALVAIGDGRYAGADPSWYESLPMNRGVALDLVIRGTRVVGLGPEPYAVDVGLTFGDAVAKTEPRIAEVGDLTVAAALDTLEVDGLYLHPAPQMLTERNGRKWLRIGAPAAFVIRRGPEPSSVEVFRIPRP